MRRFRLFLFLIIALSSFSAVSFADLVEPPRKYQSPAPKKNIQPIPSSITQNLKPLIILDAGHGGTDEGTKFNTFLEKKITLTTALLTKKHLEEFGYRVLLTRSRDIFVPLEKRCTIANNNKAALFVSLHYNASKNREAHGIEIFYCDSKERWRSHASKKLANCILYYLLDGTGAHSRGVKKGNFHVIRETEMPAVLVEGGFVTNRDERLLLRDKNYIDRVAKGIAEGIHKYLK